MFFDEYRQTTSVFSITTAKGSFTKSTAAELAFTVNQAGCALVGRPLVEATGTLENFRIQAQNLHTDLEGAYQAAVEDLISRLFVDFCPKKDPELLVLHASSHHTSNTMALWEKVRVQLGEGFTVTEIGLRNGTLSDCSGCPYTLCLHFGEKGGCFYGGLMQQEVYPAVRRCDGIVMLCPNYNDALSANLTAAINRQMGTVGLRLLDEVVPLAGYGELIGGEFSGMRFISKGGMVGDEKAMATCARYLREKI